MPSVGDLVARLMLDATNFKQGIEQYGRDVKTAKEANKDFQAGLDEISNTISTVALGAAGAGGTIFAMGRRAAQTADDIEVLHKQTGISVEQLYEMKYIAGVTGTSFDGLTQNIRMFTTRMKELGSDSDIQKAFDRLGLDASQRAKDPGAFFIQTITSLRGVSDEAERTQLAMSIFGKSYNNIYEMLMLSNPEWEKLKKNAHDTGQVFSEEYNKSLADANQTMDEMGMKLDGIITKLGIHFAPLITTLVPVIDTLSGAFDYMGDRLEFMGYMLANTGYNIKGFFTGNQTTDPTWEKFLKDREAAQNAPTKYDPQTLLTKIQSGKALSSEEMAWAKINEPILANMQPMGGGAGGTDWWEKTKKSGGTTTTDIPKWISPEDITKAIMAGWKPTQQEIADHLKEYTTAIISNQNDEWKEKNKAVIDELNKTIKSSFDITGTKLSGSAGAIYAAAVKLEAAAKASTPATKLTGTQNPYAAGTPEYQKYEAKVKAEATPGFAAIQKGAMEELARTGQEWFVVTNPDGTTFSIDAHGNVAGSVGGAVSGEGRGMGYLDISPQTWAAGHEPELQAGMLNPYLIRGPAQPGNPGVAYSEALGWHYLDVQPGDPGTIYTEGRGWHYPGMAAGGVVSSPTLAMIGEAGPEAVVPLNKSGNGGDVVVQVVIDSSVVGEAMFSKLSLLGGVK